MTPTLPGLHHVTAITAVPQANLDFYCGVLGMRLVKLTVNFDDPTSYHLYYGDELGSPGTIMTFFAWPGATRGRVGPPQLTATTLAVPAASREYWTARLNDHLVSSQPGESRFGEETLCFTDPDGMRLELIFLSDPEGHVPTGGPVPPEHAIRGIHSVTLSEVGYEKTARLLTDVMGFRAGESEGNRFRYHAVGGGFASTVDLLCVPGARHGSLGAGVVHHVAFRTPDDAEEQEWRLRMAGLEYNVTPVMDRNYFHSIYFREPGGVLFEIATNPPGFTADEAAESLGSGLKLPAQFEAHRGELERVLPALELPRWND